MPRVQWFIGMNTSEAERAMKRLEKKMKKFSRSAQRTGKAMMKYISLPLIGLGAAAGKSANDVDEAFQNIARGTGATGKQLQNLKKDWKEMADQVVQGFDESSNVFADINTRLGITGEKLQQVTENALDTARMFGEDVNTVVDASTKVFNDWNIEAENYTKLQDKMFKASQKSGISVSKLNEIIVKYGTYMRQAGFSIEDAIALVSQFEKQGIYTQRVLRGLRTGIKDLADKGIEDLAGTMQGYIEKIKNAKTETEAFSLANDIFGKSANDIVDAIHSGAFELKDFKNALENVDGAIQDADKNTKTFTEKWAQLQNTAKLALVPIGKRLMDLANTIIPKVLAKVEDLGEIIEGMSDESVSNLQKLAGVLIGSGGLIFAIGKVTSAFATMGTIIVGLASGPAAPIIVATTAAWGLYHALHKVILEQEKFAHIRPAEEIRHSGKFEDTVQNAWQSLYGRENPDKGIQTQKFYEISQALQNAVMHGKDFNKVVQTIYDLEGPTENQKIAAENRL
ncbi:MAG: phage tail tape measure protein, partial [Synergistales bacterium]|nr:phage tail tape measure protein [Synergistales bacterium]